MVVLYCVSIIRPYHIVYDNKIIWLLLIVDVNRELILIFKIPYILENTLGLIAEVQLPNKL